MDSCVFQLLNVIRDNSVIIIVGETGSGKTTQLTQVCLDLFSGMLAVIFVFLFFILMLIISIVDFIIIIIIINIIALLFSLLSEISHVKFGLQPPFVYIINAFFFLSWLVVCSEEW